MMLSRPLVATAAFRTSFYNSLVFSTLLPSSVTGGDVLFAEARASQRVSAKVAGAQQEAAAGVKVPH